MSVLGKIASSLIGSTADPVSAVGNVLDELFTSDDERLDKKIILERLRQKPGIAQVELNKVEAQHRSLFVAGWRPFIGWICATGLGFTFLINPCIQWATGKPGPALATDVMMELVLALLGLGTLRTVEKLSGSAK
jgi:hypothetical protein